MYCSMYCLCSLYCFYVLCSSMYCSKNDICIVNTQTNSWDESQSEEEQLLSTGWRGSGLGRIEGSLVLAILYFFSSLVAIWEIVMSQIFHNK